MNIIEVICVNHAQDELQDNQTLIEHQKWKKKEKSAFKRITYYNIREDKETEKKMKRNIFSTERPVHFHHKLTTLIVLRNGE
jgi:hypothetical protein